MKKTVLLLMIVALSTGSTSTVYAQKKEHKQKEEVLTCPF